MPDYRRNRVPGGTYFFTANLLDRRSHLLIVRIDALRHAIRTAQAAAAFHIDAMVVLPDHLHCLWTLPAGDTDIPGRWRAVKTAFAGSLPPAIAPPPSRVGRGERRLWQRPEWQHAIRDERDYATHMDFVHFNPVRHRLTATATAWPFSTFHRAVRHGLYPPSWCGSSAPEPSRTGERNEWR